MKVGITGWRGFIGSYLVKKLSNPILFEGNLRDIEPVRDFVKQCNRIYHLAGKNREPDGGILANNLVATGNIVWEAMAYREVELVFMSSKQVGWNPDSEYGFTKKIEEDIVMTCDRWCIFRVPNVYGVGGRPFYNSVVATFAYQIAHGLEVTIDNPNETREFIYVEDLVEQLLKPQFGEIVYVKGEAMSIRQVYEYLTSKLGEHENLKRCLDYWGENAIPIT